jgi:hypothetical protein
MSNSSVCRPPGDGNQFSAKTQGARERQLRRRVAALRKLMLGYRVKIDTLVVLSETEIERWLVARLKRTNRKVRRFHSQAKGRWRGLWIQQPTDENIACLIECLPDHEIARCDIAFDLSTRTHADAYTLQNELMLIVTQPRRGRRRITAIEETTLYWAPRNSSRNIVMYADRSLTPRLHVEFRYRGVRSCARRRIYHAQDLFALDLSKVPLEDFCLSVLNPKRLDTLVEQEAARQARQNRSARIRFPCFTRPDLMRARMQHTILAFVPDEDEELPNWADLTEFPVQDVLDGAYFLPHRYMTVRLPGAFLLAGVCYNND